MNVSGSDAETFLISIADTAGNSIYETVEAEGLFSDPDGIPSGRYQLSMAKFLESDRLLKLIYDETNQRRLLVRITPDGLMKVRRLRELAVQPTVIDRLTSERSQKLINVGNFLVALFALVVAAVALMRT